MISPSTRKNIKSSLSWIAQNLSVQQLLKIINNTNFIAPFYHCVSDDPTPHLKHLYPIKTTKEFESDLDFFMTYFLPISLDELIIKNHNKEPFEKPTFFLSFDDGMRECYDIVKPILLKKGIPCTFFVTTDFINNQTIFKNHKDSLEKENISSGEFLKSKPYLTTIQIKSLLKNGFSIGSHSTSHQLYSGLNFESQKRDVIESLCFLGINFGVIQNTFSFPYTDFGVEKAFFDWSKENLDLTFGSAGIKKLKNNHIQRIPMENYGWDAKKTIKTELLYTLHNKIKD